LPVLDWTQTLADLLRIGLAFFLALPVALERQYTSGRLGLRTFPLVAVASCGYVLIALSVLGSDPVAQSRIIQGLMTGIGFIGGGAILKQDDNVLGTATAAGLWSTGALGAAVAYDRIGIAIILSIVNLLALHLLRPLRALLEPKPKREKDASSKTSDPIQD
jgi:putative Mg2+ transporter-C (MgtC) family protein